MIKISKCKANSSIPVEKWLQELELRMTDSVERFIHKSYVAFKEDEDFKRHLWVMEDHPAQGICVAASLKWCETTETMLKEEDDIKENLEWWYTENVKQLTELTKIVSNPELDQIKRKAVVALITQDVHYRDIIEDLITEEVESYHDFKWQ